MSILFQTLKRTSYITTMISYRMNEILAKGAS